MAQTLAEKAHSVYSRTILLPDKREQRLQELQQEKQFCYLLSVNIANILSKQENTRVLVSTLLDKAYDGKEIVDLPRRTTNPSIRIQQSATMRCIMDNLTLEEGIDEQRITRRFAATHPHKQTLEFYLSRVQDWEEAGRKILAGSIQHLSTRSNALYKEYHTITKELRTQ